jgi:hypothetical protein
MVKTYPAGAYVMHIDKTLKYTIEIENHLGERLTLFSDTSKCKTRGLVIENNGPIHIKSSKSIVSDIENNLFTCIQTIKNGTFRVEYLELF